MPLESKKAEIKESKKRCLRRIIFNLLGLGIFIGVTYRNLDSESECKALIVRWLLGMAIF